MDRVVPIILRSGRIFWLILVLLVCPLARAELWSTAYYPGYRQSAMPASKVDFTALTHVIHFALLPNTDGTLDSSANSVTLANSSDLVAKAHSAGKKVLICVGGAGSSFVTATSGTNMTKFTTNLVNFMVARGYDGIDIDWEPIDSADTNQFAIFINGLRTRLNTITPRPLLCAAVAWQPSLIASLQNQFDQINIMTYDMSGTWSGWVSWYNAPLYDGGYRFPSTGGLVPSTQSMVNTFTNAGVSPQKLGIGLAFYGKIWSGGVVNTTNGITGPRQSWSTAPTLTTASFDSIMTTYYQSNLYHWDTNAQSAYLGLDNAGSSNDKFISYDDEHACQAKVSFARNRRLGGIMIWELGEGYRASQPVGQRDPLLQAVKQALAPPRLTGITRTNQNIQVSFNSMPLALYRVQWNANFGSTNWSTLTTNIVGDGGTLQVTDTNALLQARRFYRVQTPP
ncbi:MAG: hypothetical protein JWM68_2868 [Verrucomicrobiales bacterium]|nr:hypothetical protein [Verrucomicrobiales bacterium]